MKRIPYVVAGGVFAVLFGWQSCLLLTREPPHPKASLQDDDYPLQVGLTWIYKSNLGVQIVRRVAPARVISGEDPMFLLTGTWFEMQFELPLLGRKSLLMERTTEGVEARRGNLKQVIMRFPMKPGDSWVIDFPGDDLAECTVVEPEVIDVLGKKSKASKLQILRTNRKTGKKVTDYEWYVRGIGLARMQVTFGIKATFELERFEHAK